MNERNLKVERIFKGNFCSALDMHGISITLFFAENEKEIEYLDLRTNAPGWPVNNYTSCENNEEDRIIEDPSFSKSNLLKERKKDFRSDFSVFLKNLIFFLVSKLKQSIDYLTELDKISGDSDLGFNLLQFLELFEKQIEFIEFDDISSTFYSIGSLMLEHWGGFYLIFINFLNLIFVLF